MRRLEHCNIVKLKYFFYSSGDKVSSFWRQTHWINPFVIQILDDNIVLDSNFVFFLFTSSILIVFFLFSFLNFHFLWCSMWTKLHCGRNERILFTQKPILYCKNQKKCACEVWLQPIRYGHFFGNLETAGSQFWSRCFILSGHYMRNFIPQFSESVHSLWSQLIFHKC